MAVRNEKDWRESVLDEHVGQDEIPTLSALGGAKALMVAINSQVEAENPLRAIQLHLDDRPILSTLVEIGMVTQDNVSDILGLTTNGRVAIGLKPKGTLDLPVEVAEVTGNVEERELVARYLEGKMAAIDRAITAGNEPLLFRSVSWQESYQHVALTLGAAAKEFRAGLHIPDIVLGGRVIPYNEDRSTGISHQAALRMFFIDVHERNVKAGWWTDIKTGEPMKRSVGEIFILMVTELAEAYDAWMLNLPDDKLSQHPGVGVELGDLAIRLADFCGALLAGRVIDAAEGVAVNPGARMFEEIREIAMRYEKIRKTPECIGDPEQASFLPPMDVAVMIDDKLAFNAQRPDHKIENRLKDDGKRT